jgi:hypothetical protein
MPERAQKMRLKYGANEVPNQPGSKRADEKKARGE